MEYILWKFKNGIFLVWLASITSLLFYFNFDIFQYSKHNIKDYRPLKFKTLLYNNPIYFNATWVSDDEIVTRDNSGNIILFDVHKSIKSILAFSSMQHMKNCYKYELSADKKYILIAYDFNKSFNSKLTGHYDVINIKTGKQVTLRDTHHVPRDIMMATWSPTNSSLVIVDNYNLYYIPTAAKPNNVKQLTFHGSKNFFIGIPDSVYQEEILESNSAIWFSKHGTNLAYASFNETKVPSVYLSQYGIPDTMYDQYSKIFSFHYSKVNDPNPIVELFVQPLNITIDEPVPIPIKPTKQYSNETILYDVLWSNDDHLFAMWMNRIQNESHLVHYHVNNGTSKVKEVMEFSQENGWLDFRRSILIGPDHRVAIICLQEQDDGDSYGHICLPETNDELRPITNGKFEVLKLVKWDFESNYIYYLANTKNNPETQLMYRIQVDAERQQVEPECLTCNEDCSFSSAALSKKNTYFAHICSGPTVPYVNIVKTNGDTLTTWETNKKLKTELLEVDLPRVVYVTVPLVDNYTARVRLSIPPTVNVFSGIKYPLLVYTYGGPIYNVALDKFKIDLNMYLCTNHEIIIAEVDGRGTGRRGIDTLFANYKKLGTGEIEDQKIIVKYLQSKFSFVDGDRIGIWGWSYGGYVAGMVLAKDNENLFKYALSVAPITDWIYYDSMYTERLMDSYNENFQSYRNASLIENAEGLRYKKYMMIHGLADTNVLFQNSAMLSKELQHQVISFKQQFYPDESHKFLNVRKHLYRTIILFIKKCLKIT